jgi:ribokinase
VSPAVSAVRSIVVVGSLNRDYLCRVDRLPGPGETRIGSDLTVWCGGKGGNQAVAAALVGADRGVRVSLVGAVGDDDDGTALLSGLREAGVDVEDVAARTDSSSGAALITVAEDGENTIVVASGANASVTVEQVTAVLGRRTPDLVLAQGELSPQVVTATIRAAVELGARPVLNLAPAMPLDPDVLAACDPLVVNVGEALAVLGRAPRESPDLESLTRDLADRARSVVVTGGPAGAWVGASGAFHHVPARPAVVVDTTGAGDAFTGALAVGLTLDRNLTEAAAWGAVVAAYAVGRPGTQASFPGVRDVDLG